MPSSRSYAVYQLFAITFLLISLSSCTSAPADEIPKDVAQLDNLTVISSDAEPAHAIKLKEDAIFGDTEDVILGQIIGATVDKQGRVYIGDRDKNIIHVYGSDGNYRTQLGQEGRGPGEFKGVAYLRTDDKYIYAYDFNQRLIKAFELKSLEFSHAVSLRNDNHDIEELTGYYPGQYHVLSDGRLLVSYNKGYGNDDLDEERKTLFYLVDEDGNPSEKLIELPANEVFTHRDGSSFMVMFLPFGRRSMLSLADDDKIYTAWSEDFLIKIYSPDGTYDRAIYHPYKQSELDKSEVLKDYEGDRQRKIVRNAEAPDTWPALNSMTVDDEGRLWISTVTDNRDEYDWWVIDEGGELLAQFTWPENRSLVKVRNDKLYAIGEDEETGLEQVVSYDIEFL